MSKTERSFCSETGEIKNNDAAIASQKQPDSLESEPLRISFGGNVYSEDGPLTKKRFDQEFVAQQRVHRMVLPELEQKFAAILKEREWQRLPELGPGIVYPRIEEWVNFRISSGQGVKFYPCLIQDEHGITRFLKVQITRKNGRFGVPTNQIIAKEARVLQSGILPVQTPAYVDHSDGGENSLAFLCVEAIDLQEGQVLSSEEWSSLSSKSAASQIHLLEDVSLTQRRPLFADEADQSTDMSTVASELIRRTGSYLDAGVASEVLALIQEEPLPNVFVHGDLTLDNVIVRTHRGVEFIDWETAGIGFLGRDASKLLGGLAANSSAKDAFITAYVTRGNRVTGNEVFDQQRLRGLYLGKIIENLTHLVWRVERLTPALEPSYPGIREKIPVFHENIRLEVTEYRHQLEKYSDLFPRV